MARPVLATAPSASPPYPLFLCGERPGWEEARAGRPFVGKAGTELWHRFALAGVPSRASWYVTNLVKTFSTDPPSPAEIAQWELHLKGELKRARPSLVVAAGAHAARWFLPGLLLEAAHGLPHASPRCKCPVIATFHPSAALRQPERYAEAFAADCRAIARALASTSKTRVVHCRDRHDVYIGRPSKWGNPFVIGRDGTREEVITKYEQRLLNDPFLLASLPEVRGKVLGCWCAPKPCHGHVIARLADCSMALHSALPPVINLARAEVLPGRLLGCDTEGIPGAVECVTLADASGSAILRPHQPRALARAVTGKRLSFHNATADLKNLSELGLDPDGLSFDDSMLMAYLLGEFAQGLKTLVYRECGLKLQDYSDLIEPIDEARVRAAIDQFVQKYTPQLEAAMALKGKAKAAARKLLPTRALSSAVRMLANTTTETSLRKRWGNSVYLSHAPLPKPATWADVPRSLGVEYACGDAIGHYQLRETLWPRIKAEGLTAVYRMDRGVLPMIARMETVGLAVDVPHLQNLSRKLERRYVEVCAEIESILGYALNPKASEDVSETLFEELGVTPTKLTKSGKHYTTQDKYLKAREKEHAVIPQILEGRELWKLKSSYCDRLPGLVKNGRYYPDFTYTRTASGRLAETIILLIPKHSKQWGHAIRNAFHAGPGRVLVSVDLSQIEMRTMAHESQDEVLLGVYRSGGDVHADTAHRMLNAPVAKKDQDESLHRLPAKTLNFGILMGMTEFGLLDQLHSHGQLHWTEESCREFRENWFLEHPGVDRYVAKQKRLAYRLGYVEDMWGRRKRLASIHSSDPRIVREAERQAHAVPIQAGADGISKHWMREVYRRICLPRRRKGVYCEPWVRVHDDLILEVDAHEAQAVRDELIALVPQVLCIPTLADGKIGERWGELE